MHTKQQQNYKEMLDFMLNDGQYQKFSEFLSSLKSFLDKHKKLTDKQIIALNKIYNKEK